MDDNQVLLNKLMGRYKADPFDREVYPITEYKRVEMPADERASIDPDGAIDGTVGATTELEP
jgi:hypothetical protein